MLAVPGNHDWYDGLTVVPADLLPRAVDRGLAHEQTRSYFAVQLPHGWWLVGLDIQLEPLYRRAAAGLLRRRPDRQLGRATASSSAPRAPTWLTDRARRRRVQPPALVRAALHPLEPRAGSDKREPTGAAVRLWLTGDPHHYARYVEVPRPAGPARRAPRQMVTCGLGGAFLSATHHCSRLPGAARGRRAAIAQGDDVHQLPPRRSPLSRPRDVTLDGERPRQAGKRNTFLLARNPGLLPLVAGVHTALFLALLLMFGQGSIVASEGRTPGRLFVLNASPRRLGGSAWPASCCTAHGIAVRSCSLLPRSGLLADRLSGSVAQRDPGGAGPGGRAARSVLARLLASSGRSSR